MKIPQSLRVRIREGHVGPSICVATPAYDHRCTVPFVQSMLRLQKTCDRLGVALHWLTISGTPVDRARDLLVQQFRDKPHFGDVLVFIDSDEGWPARAVFDVVRLAQTRDVVAAAVPFRAVSWRNVWKAAQVVREEHAEQLLPLVSSTGRVVAPMETVTGPFDVLECKGAGTGFLAIHRRVFDQIEAAHPELRSTIALQPAVSFFMPFISNGSRLGEDIAFCHRWRALGGRCWAIAWHNMIHSGMTDTTDDMLVRAQLGVPM